MTQSEKCPKCGLVCARESEVCWGFMVINDAGTELHRINGEGCLRRQLDAMAARALVAEQQVETLKELRGVDAKAYAELEAVVGRLAAACKGVVESAYTPRPTRGWDSDMEKALQEARQAAEEARA